MRTRRWIFIACYGASGAAALIYQVAWVRLFTLTLGHTAAASSTVLAAFMGGLSLGAWAAGRLRSERSRNLRIYAALEFLIAAIAVGLPTVFSTFEPLIASAYAEGTSPLSFAIIRVAVSLLLLGIPAAAMAQRTRSRSRGSPTPGCAFAGSAPAAAIDGGVLYGVNTAARRPARLQRVRANPITRHSRTTWIGFVLNMAAGCGAFCSIVPSRPLRLRRDATASPATVAGSTNDRRAAADTRIDRARHLGVCPLAYEVACTGFLR